MKINVKVGNTTYNVEIEDLNARPVVTTVDGVRVEVTPENASQPQARKEAGAIKVTKPIVQSTPANQRVLPSPLPGIIIEVFVKVGDEIESGQVVLVIEAMKMKNSIRSPRGGKVAAVMVAAGQTVQHKQPLLEFEP